MKLVTQRDNSGLELKFIFCCKHIIATWSFGAFIQFCCFYKSMKCTIKYLGYLQNISGTIYLNVFLSSESAVFI